jgi:fused signal recognition particle receptor
LASVTLPINKEGRQAIFCLSQDFKVSEQGNFMETLESGDTALGVMDTLTQMVKVLGFHDLWSFIMVAVFVIAALAFLLGGSTVIFRKRKERLKDLEAIVHEVQKEALTKPSDEDVPKSPESLPKVLESQPTPLIVPKPKKFEEPRKVEELKKAEEPGKAEERKKVEEPKATHEAASLGSALKKTRSGFMAKLSRLFSHDQEISDADFLEMEAILFTADIGAKTAQKLLDVMRERSRQEKNPTKEFLRSVLKEEMTRILESAPKETSPASANPKVVMFVGVNGAGKTTSIGKLGAQLKESGKKVLFGAGDTFRAAAVEQLSIWGERIGAEVVCGKENSDSASVLFDAIEKAKAKEADYVLCDTAGRLHTKSSLMDELKKVHRVVAKAQAGAPHEVYIVIDATTGQNAINQAREFAQATPLTGVVLSKLDGTAKGGVALGIVDELRVPIRYVGVGEQIADLKDFDAKLFVDALFEEA